MEDQIDSNFWKSEAMRLRNALEHIAAGSYPLPLYEDVDAWRRLASIRKDIAQKALDNIDFENDQEVDIPISTLSSDQKEYLDMCSSTLVHRGDPRMQDYICDNKNRTTAETIKNIREQLPEGYEILPIRVIEILIYAGLSAYAPAFGGSDEAVTDARNAARAARNVLTRRKHLK